MMKIDLNSLNLNDLKNISNEHIIILNEVMSLMDKSTIIISDARKIFWQRCTMEA